MTDLEGLGPVTGLVGLLLAAGGVLLALVAGLWLLFLIRKPGKGRVAVAIAAAGLVLILCGAALVVVEEVNALRVLLRATDRVPWLLVGVSGVLAALAGVRAWRRRRARAPAGPEVEDPERAGPAAIAEAAGERTDPPQAAGG